MGNLEKESRRKIRKTKLQHAVLAAVATVGVLSVGLIAPNVIGAMGKLGLIPRSRTGDSARTAASRLKKKGLLKFADGHYSLTDAGIKALERWENEEYQIKTPKKWDGKWRVIIFDIPEKKRKIRVEARRILSQAGFLRLQDSVWVHPYDCEDVIGLMKTDLGIGREMLYLIVDQLENDRHLKYDFGLI